MHDEGLSESHEVCYSPKSITVVDTIETLLGQFNKLLAEEQLSLMSEMFCSHASIHCQMNLPEDFLTLSLKGMKHLSETKRMNVLYELAKGLGIMRPDWTDSLFPTSRMPMGMLQFMVGFFNASPGRNVSTHYSSVHLSLTVQIIYKSVGHML